MPLQPPDLGLGKFLAVAGSVLMLWRIIQGIRTWRGNRLRARRQADLQREREAAQQERRRHDA